MKPLLSLKGVRVLSLALNLPGPGALQRLRHMGATCIKLEPPPPISADKKNALPAASADPMSLYGRKAYDALHEGIRMLVADLKSDQGQKALHRELAKAQVLITSFRPGALRKLGLDWSALRGQYPSLSMVSIVGAHGERADEPGHDLTYQAENDLISALELPPTLYADMGGALMTSEAVLQAVLLQRQKGKGGFMEVALSDAAAYLALPRVWGLMAPGTMLSGRHAGYRVYACRDGRVALAALEPHFARALCALVGIKPFEANTMMAPATQERVAAYLSGKTRKTLEALAREHDIPLHTLAK